MSKNSLFILVLIVIVISATSVLFVNSLSDKPSKTEIDSAINQARLLYEEKIKSKEDLSLGPCLSNAIIPNWAVDLVHNSRQPIDDLAENQCPSYLEGRVKHFVELDLDGKLVRVK